MLLNQRKVREFVKSKQPDLRVSGEFLFALDIIVRERIAKAIQRNRSLNLKTLKRDQLHM